MNRKKITRLRLPQPASVGASSHSAPPTRATPAALAAICFQCAG
jgi:hypothetical protein